MKKLIYILLLAAMLSTACAHDRDIYPTSDRKFYRPATTIGHALLSDTHTDTTTDAVTRGSIVYGNATPAWDELVIGAANTFLTSDGTDASWGSIDISDDTNLAVTAPITLTDDTIGWDSTLIDDTTWSDGANASNIWTFNLSGTNPTLTFGNDLISVNGNFTVPKLITTDTLTITDPANQNCTFQQSPGGANALALVNSNAANPCVFLLANAATTNANSVQFRLNGLASGNDFEYLNIQWVPGSPGNYLINTNVAGAGVTRAIHLGTVGNASQFVLNTDGTTDFGGDVDIDGDLSIDNLSVNSVVIYTPSSITDIVAANGITATNKIMRVRSSTAGDTDITANPQIADGTNGQPVRIYGEDDTKTVTLDDGNGLQLASGVTFTLGLGDVIQLTYFSSVDIWREDFRADN